MKNLYVLLVGVNDYASPNPKLKGCIKDIDQIEGYLNEFCSKDYNLQIRRLENSSATYANIIKGFREHLASAGSNDVAWFHFSGHGSEEKTAPEFLTLEPNGKDQTLLCIDSGINGVPHLADKELAVLLNELATKNKGGEPHIVVSLDCCHSGTGTRGPGENITWSSRAVPSSGKLRTLDSYIDGYYSQLKSLEVPSSKHVLLSACKSVQTAGDMPQGGAFTTGLIKALRAAKGNLSYTDLFLKSRSSVQTVRDNQTPQFDTVQNFDPYTRFLEGSPTGDRDWYEVVKQDGNWYVKCGAIHGLPTQPAAPIELDIYSAPPAKALKGSAKIKSVGAHMSKIEVEGDIGGVINFFKQLTSDEIAYRATLRQLSTPPDLALLSGDSGLIQTLVSNEKLRPATVAWAQPAEKASIEVKLEPSGITIMDLDKGRKAFVTDGSDEDHLTAVMDALNKIVQWRRFIELQNKNRASKVKDMVQFELHEINEQDEITKKHTADHIRVFASSKDLSNRIPYFRPVVHLHNIQQPLYLYLFFVGYDYSIDCPGGEVIYRPSEHDDKSNVEIPLWKNKLGWGPAPHNVEDTCHYKLLVTTEALDHQQFNQSGLGTHRDILGEPTPEKVFDDWTTVDISVTLVRQDNSLNASSDVTLADGNIKIKAHPSVTATVSVGHVESNARGTGPIEAFSRLQHGDGVQMVDFSPSRSIQTQNVIEIDNIQLEDENSLLEQPLEITLNQVMEDDSLLLPVAFDGKHFRVVGDAVSDEQGTHVKIHEIPDIENENGTGERGLLKSLKMTFCKVSLGQKEINQLRWVEMLPDGSIALQRENLGLKVGKAKKVMLVMHGLAGDGATMVKSLFDNLPADQLKSYDLILAYDYESLNTPLDETATALHKTLTEYGFGNDDRKITIICHSIGGLIARWIIEQKGGHAFVGHCILVGTPNNGSMFGRVDGYVKWAQTAVDLAINFIPTIIPFTGIILKFFKAAADLGGSIAQIDPQSEFINKLNSSKDPGIKYTVISGDATGIDTSGSGYDGFIEKAKSKLSKWMNSDEPNDLFAPVRSLQCKELWEGRNPENKIMDPLANHHFGYFLAPNGSRDTNTVWKAIADEL